MARVVEIIPARSIHQLREETAKLRVCAYCRVSTDSEEQLSSFDAQVSYYTTYIQNHPAWEFVGIYSDEGISATNTKKRVEFNRMIEHCLEGKIDMVITKSISRFARNTVDCLTFVRKLKERNIAVFFEKENVNTLDSKGDFLLTLLGSLAQEESHSISQASKQGIVYRFREGKVRVNHNKFLGYTKNEDGDLVIDQEQAEIVVRIFTAYLEGQGCGKIALGLEKDCVCTGSGGTKWHESGVRKILQNEKYMGDALLQKTYTVDFLSKKRVINEGHVPQYYVEDSHPPIIPKQVFEAAQEEMKRRSELRGYTPTGKSCYTAKYPFSGRLVCGHCGATLTRKQWSSENFVWLCRNRVKNGVKACSQKAVKEPAVEQAFLRAVAKMVDGKVLQNIAEGIDHKGELAQVEGELVTLQNELMVVARMRARDGIEEAVYAKEHKRLSMELEELRRRREKVKEDVVRHRQLQEYLKDAQSLTEVVTEFDGALFMRLVERVLVKAKGLVFEMKTGVKI